MNRKKVFIDGSAGTTGLRIHERLEKRDDIELITLSEDKRKDLNERKRAIESADAAFLCLPDSAAREIVPLIESPDVKIFDTSTAHRTDPQWAYGFPELSKSLREKIKQSKRIAVPGCHASGFLSIVAPLVAHGVIGDDYPVSAVSVTGYSGGGKQMIAEYESGNSEELKSPRQYGLSQRHKHLPEMKVIGGLKYEPCFSPIVSNYYSGMEVSVPLFRRMLKKKLGIEEIHALLSVHYSSQSLVKVAPLGKDGMLAANMKSDKDSMEIFVMGNDERILIASVFDNLGKGASGAAIQCFNIAFDEDETKGLVL